MTRAPNSSRPHVVSVPNKPVAKRNTDDLSTRPDGPWLIMANVRMEFRSPNASYASPIANSTRAPCFIAH